MADKTIEEFAALLLEQGFDPQKIKKATLRDIIAAQKLLIDQKRLSLQENAMDKAFKILMSGTIAFTDEIIEGEEVPELQAKMLEEVKVAAKRKATDPVPTYANPPAELQETV